MRNFTQSKSADIYVFVIWSCSQCSHLNVNFTKNPDKYFKYKPTELKSVLNTFFDGQSA